MCDTVYVGSPFAVAGRSYFAKNSDRHPEEPQMLLIAPRRAPSGSVDIGPRRFPIADSGHAYVLSKPSWIQGGEMGVNDAGVAIGNEAVFSKIPTSKDGVLGMDILRAALSSAASGEEAVSLICRLVEGVDQGGNAAYRGRLVYSNSYLIADPHGAYVLETAGRRWAWRAVEGRDAISNAYVIETDYKRLDAQTRKEIAPVNERAACSDEADPGRKGKKESWRARVERPPYRRLTHADERRAALLGFTSGVPGSVNLEALLAALRWHRPSGRRGHVLNRLDSLCVHAGGLFSQASTASMVVAYEPGTQPRAVLWFTGTSYPCLSLYKPLLLADGRFTPLWSDYDYSENTESSLSHWKRQHEWITRTRTGGLGCNPAFVQRRDQIQGELIWAARDGLDTGDHAAAARRVDSLVREWYEGLSGW
ncbi:MAG TPA: carcinine hydrolase/isopenicillin-N N-acyltransferase family protein [Rectinemataceae bacterium]|nr:carcinine hydrolase/isopenicillin-N N-acyltransferase family protein [Rectinemataceae bacterium]